MFKIKSTTFLLVCITVTLLINMLYPAFGTSEASGQSFAGGDGQSPETAFQISNWHHLNNMRSHMTSHFVLLNDLDTSTEGYSSVASASANSGQGWIPLGDYSTAFSGNFDGAGFSIRDLNIINPADVDFAGFIQFADNAGIKDLHFRNINVSSSGHAAGVAGAMFNSTIERVSVTGTITAAVGATCCSAGGITSWLSENSSLTEVMGNVTATGAFNTSAIASVVDASSSINKAIAQGTLNGTNQLGGVAGENSGIIQNSYSIVTLQDATNTGGFVAVDFGHISNSYASAVSPNGQFSPITGICNNCTRTNVFYNMSGPATLTEPSMATGLSTVLMLSQGIFTGFDFTPDTGIWQTGSALSDTFPYLQGFTYDDPLVSGGPNPLPGLQLFAGGNGSSDTPYLISNWFHLNNVRHRLGSHHKLLNHLDENTLAYEELASPQAHGGAGWIPLGTFTGTFSGDGYAISNLFINRPDWDDMGLFSILRGGTVRDLMLLDVDFTGRLAGGPVAGVGDTNFVVYKVFTTGFVKTAGHDSFGGARGSAGGLIGRFSNNGSVYDVHTAVRLRGAHGGGLFGSGVYAGGTMNISNVHISCNFDEIHRRDWIGALTGRFNNTVVPQNIEGLFWDVSVTGGLAITQQLNLLPLPAGGQALNSAQMRTKSVFENAGFDFDTIWEIQEGDYESYPYLQIHRHNAPGDINPQFPIPALRLNLENLTEEPLGAGTAMAFNGTSDYINTRMSDTMLGIPQDSFTVEAWIRLNNTSGDNPILGHPSVVVNNASLHLIVRNAQLNMGFFSNDLTAARSLQANRWYHVAFVFDNNAGEQRIYVDGIMAGLRETYAFDAHPDGINAPLLIGRWLSSYFNGSMNELRIWQGARTTAEIQGSMNRTLPRNTPGLLANYTFNEAQTDGYFNPDHSGNRIFEVTQNAPVSIADIVNNPSWFAPVMPLGQHSIFLPPNTTSESLSDANLSIQAQLGLGSLSLYRYGNNSNGFIALAASDPVAAEFDESTLFINRTDAVFGVFPTSNSTTATLTLNYDFYEDGALQLLTRSGEGSKWTRATGWTHDPVQKNYTFTGSVQEQQLALTRPVTRLQSRVMYTGNDASGNALLTLEVSNTGLSDLASVAVQISSQNIENLSSPDHTLSGSTWTIPVLKAGEQAALHISGELTAYLGEVSLNIAATNFESEAGSVLNASGIAIPEAFGAEGALALSGDSFITTGKNAAELGLTEASFTIETWVRFNSLPAGDAPLVGVATGGSNNNSLHLTARNQRLHMGFWNNDTTAGTALQTGVWYHTAFVYDLAAQEQRIYLNGQLDGTGTSRPPLGGAAEFHIGRFITSFLNGTVDEFRIWNRALSQAEIQQHLHEVVAPSSPRFNDLTVYLRFDDRNGNATADLRGTATATIEGSPQWVTQSSAPVGQTGNTLIPGQAASTGPQGAEVSIQNLSGGGLSVFVSATTDLRDRRSSDAGEHFPGSIEARRRGVSWHLLPENGSTTGTISLNYNHTSTQTGLTSSPYTQGLVERVLYRETPESQWQIQTNWTHNEPDQTFTRTGEIVAGEYSTALVVDTIVPVSPNLSGWRIIGAPGPLATYAEILADIWTQGYPGAGNSEDGDSNVYLYNETTRSWEIPLHSSHIFGTRGTDQLSSGKAALIFMYEDDNDLQIRHTGFPLITGAEISLTNTNPDNLPAIAGWHLVSNPYPFPVSWEAVVQDGLTGVSPGIFIFDTTLFENEGGYRFFTPGTGALTGETGHDGIIPPFQGFWVQANAANGQTSTISITAEHAATGGSMYRAGSGGQHLAIQSENETVAPLTDTQPLMMAIRATHPASAREDVAIVSLFDQNASAMTPVYRPAVLAQHQLSVELWDKDGFPALMQYHAPEDDSIIQIPLHIQSSRSGLHQLTLSDNWLTHSAAGNIRVYLTDQHTGEQLLWNPGSTIELQLEETLGRGLSETAGLTVSQSASDNRQPSVRTSLQQEQNSTERANPNFSLMVPSSVALRTLPNGLTGATLLNKGIQEQNDARFMLEIHYGNLANEGEIPGTELPLSFELYQNYPNPFNPTTSIRYGLPESAEVRLEVFNLLGQRVALLQSGPQTAGFHTIEFDASRLASGVYVYRLQTGSEVFIRKMTLVK